MKFGKLISQARSVETTPYASPCVLHEPQPHLERANFGKILDYRWEIKNLGGTRVITKTIGHLTAKGLLQAIMNGAYRPYAETIGRQSDVQQQRIESIDERDVFGDFGSAVHVEQSTNQLTFGQFCVAYVANWEKFDKKLKAANSDIDSTNNRRAKIDGDLPEDKTSTPIPEDAEDATYALPSELLSELNADNMYDGLFMGEGSCDGKAMESSQQPSRGFYTDAILNHAWVDTARVGVPRDLWPTTRNENQPGMTRNGPSTCLSASPAPNWPPPLASTTISSSSPASSMSSSMPTISTPSTMSIGKHDGTTADLRRLERRAKHVELLDSLLLECNLSFDGSKHAQFRDPFGSPSVFDRWQSHSPLVNAKDTFIDHREDYHSDHFYL